LFSARGSGHGRCVKDTAFKGILRKGNIWQLKMEVEYIEKPRGGAFRSKTVECDKDDYVNQKG
jgi:hypothetical protein